MSAYWLILPALSLVICLLGLLAGARCARRRTLRRRLGLGCRSDWNTPRPAGFYARCPVGGPDQSAPPPPPSRRD